MSDRRHNSPIQRLLMTSINSYFYTICLIYMLSFGLFFLLLLLISIRDLKYQAKNLCYKQNESSLINVINWYNLFAFVSANL